MNNPRWFQLIEAHQQLRGKYGLTIPFLIGGPMVAPKSRKVIAPDDPQAAVRSLFASILDEMPVGRVAYIHMCSDLGGQPVVALHSDGDSMQNPLKSPLQNRVTVFAEDVFLPAANYSVNSLVQRFSSDFSADIAAMNYSFRGRTYGPLSDEDFELIEMSRSFE